MPAFRPLSDKLLGAVKDMSNALARKNVNKKKKRGVIRYNLYEFEQEGKIWWIKLEETNRGLEQFYSLVKR